MGAWVRYRAVFAEGEGIMETVLVVSADYGKSEIYVGGIGLLWPDSAISRRAPNLISIHNLLVLAVRAEDKSTIIMYKGRLHRPTIIVLLDTVVGDKRLLRHVPFFHYIDHGEFTEWMRILSALWRRRNPIQFDFDVCDFEDAADDALARSRELAKRLIAAAYGVPPDMIGRNQC